MLDWNLWVEFDDDLIPLAGVLLFILACVALVEVVSWAT